MVYETVEDWLAGAASGLKLVLEFASVLCVAIGFWRTLQTALRDRQLRRRSPGLDLRIAFGSWLVLALEFQLGADILATTVSPSFEALGQLGAVAAIRTFLNYFLNQELEAEMRLKAQGEPTFEPDLPARKLENPTARSMTTGDGDR